MSAALYAVREGIETLIIERSGIGGQAGTTERIDNYPGFAQGIGGAELADAMREHAERFDVEILPAQTVTSIEAQGDYKMISTESGDRKSTRLNSSHKPISYAVFCLKKKTKHKL